MGLDIFLNKKVQIGSKYGMCQSDTVKITTDLRGNELTLHGYEIVEGEITVQSICWRKANAIAKWFARNIPSWKDDEGVYPVTEEMLRKLLLVAKKIKQNPSRAPRLLPTWKKMGSFCGSEYYDDFYLADIEYTINALEKVLTNVSECEGISYTYQATW